MFGLNILPAEERVETIRISESFWGTNFFMVHQNHSGGEIH